MWMRSFLRGASRVIVVTVMLLALGLIGLHYFAEIVTTFLG